MSKTSRRRFLELTALSFAALFSRTARADEPAPPPPKPIPVGARPKGPLATNVTDPISITLAFADGTSKQFSEEGSVELAPYTDPKGAFVQHCRMAARADSPFTVFFRPDRQGGRVEVVIELGWQGMNPAHSGPYTATISRSGQKLASVKVPAHYWWSRWRWQSAPRPVRTSPAELMGAGLVPMLARNIVSRQDAPDVDDYTPMSLPGLVLDMEATGERPEIGLMTDPQARYLCTESRQALRQLLVQAEAHASVPVHVRDETLAPISILRYPTASSFWSQFDGNANPWVAPLGDTPIMPQKAHYPSLDYVPFLLTGDPYFLEELQFAANFALLSYNTEYRQRDKGILAAEETRGWAWSMRSLFQSYLMTGAQAPGWMAPQKYFKRMIDNNLIDFMTNQVGDKNDPLKATCHFAIDTSEDHIAPWQQDFVSAVLGWAVGAGFSDWVPAYHWQVGQAIGRATGAGGYPRSIACPYYYKTKGATDWASLAAVNGFTGTSDGNFPSDTDQSYASYFRGALTLAARLNVPGAQEAYAYADKQSDRLGGVAFKWAFAR